MLCATKELIVVIALAVVTLAGCGRSGQEKADSNARDAKEANDNSPSGVTASESSKGKEPGAESPRALLKRLANAFNNNDVDELVACTAPPSVSDADRKQFRKNAEIVVHAQGGARAFLEKGLKKVGKDRLREILGATGFTLAMMSARPDFETMAKKAEVNIEGDTAMVTYDYSADNENKMLHGGDLTLKRIEGRWYYPLAESDRGAEKMDESWAALQRFLEEGGKALDEAKDADDFEARIAPALTHFNAAMGLKEPGFELRPSPPRRSSNDELIGIFPQPARLPEDRQWQLETVAPRGAVESLSFTSDGRLLACGTNRWSGGDEPAGSLRVYDVATQNLQFVAHGNIFASVAWSPDDSWLAAGSHDFTVRLWRADGKVGPILKGHRHFVDCVAWSPDGRWLASASWDKTVRLWKLDGTPGPVLKGHDRPVAAVAWSPDGQWLASGGWDETVRLWQPDGTPGPVLKGHSSNVTSLAWSPDSERLVSGSKDDGLRIWQADGTLVQAVKDYDDVEQLSWSPDGHWITVAAGIIHFVKPDGSRGERRLIHSSLRSVAWSPDGQWIASGGGPMDHSIHLWKPDGTPGPVITRAQWNIGRVLWRPDGDFWTVSPDRSRHRGKQQTLGLWKADATPGPWLLGHKAEVECVAWSPDGQRLATGGGSDDATVRIWKNDGTPGPVLRGHRGGVELIAWSPDGKWLASAGAFFDKTVRLWKAEGTAGPVVARDVQTEALMWGPGAAWLATLGDTREGHLLSVWKPNGSQLASIKVKGRSPATSLSPDGNWIAVTDQGDDGDVILLKPDGTRGPELKSESRHGVEQVTWSPDGSWLAGFADSSRSDIELWKTDGTRGPTIKLNRSNARDVVFSPKGNRLAVATRRFVGVWELDGSQGPRLDMEDAVTVAWHPDGERLLIGRESDSVVLWNPSNPVPAWMTVMMPDDKSAAITGTGKLVHGDLSGFERHYVYVVKSTDNHIRYLKPSEFLSAK